MFISHSRSQRRSTGRVGGDVSRLYGGVGSGAGEGTEQVCLAVGGTAGRAGGGVSKLDREVGSGVGEGAEQVC